MVICLERGADLHMAQWMPLPLTVSCFSKIQIGFTCLVPAHLGSPGKRAVKRVCVCMSVCVFYYMYYVDMLLFYSFFLFHWESVSEHLLWCPVNIAVFMLSIMYLVSIVTELID